MPGLYRPTTRTPVAPSDAAAPVAVRRGELAITLVACVAVYALAVRIELLESLMEWSRAHEDLEIDELLTLVFVLCCAFALLGWRRWRELRAEFARRRSAMSELRASHVRFATAFDASPQPQLILELDGGATVDVNEAFVRLCGWPRETLLTRDSRELRLWEHAEQRERVLQRLRTEGRTPEVEIALRPRAGEVRAVLLAATVVEIGGRQCVLTSISDVTERRALEQALAHQALHDPLTQLANRTLLADRTAHALARAARDGSDAVGVLFVDLDDFKRVNDGLGHAAGDALLQVVATRLLASTRGSDTVARLGGDEFAVLLEGDVAGAMQVADRISAALRRPVTVAGREVVPNGSIGMAMARPGEDAGVLLRNADVAMYAAKERGKGCVALFEPEMQTAVATRLELETDLQAGLSRGEFSVAYQPIVDVGSGRTIGVEALARWQHPTRGSVPPSTFIPVAEDTGHIVALGRWVLREACRQMAEWRALPRSGQAPPLTMAVNVSGRQLNDDALVEDVRAALAESGLDPAALVLEITESSIVQDSDQTLARLHALKALGLRLAIDDFGTGYSSLSYLRQFPIDVLKIDKSFIDGVARSGHEAALARTIIALAETLTLHCVAEGVETSAQLAQLRGLGCGYAQGYLFARPMTPALLTAQLRDTTSV